MVNRHSLNRQRNGAAVRPRKDWGRSLLHLLERHRAGRQKAKHDPNPARHTPLTVLPTPHAARTNTKQRRNTLLRNAKRAKCLVKFGRGHAPVSICPEST
jgi:hypothetical protein